MMEWLDSINQYFNDLGTAVNTIYADLHSYITLSKAFMVVAIILIVLIAALVWSLHTKIDKLNNQNVNIQNKLNDILLQVGGYKKSEGGNKDGTTTERDD